MGKEDTALLCHCVQLRGCGGIIIFVQRAFVCFVANRSRREECIVLARESTGKRESIKCDNNRHYEKSMRLWRYIWKLLAPFLAFPYFPLVRVVCSSLLRNEEIVQHHRGTNFFALILYCGSHVEQLVRFNFSLSSTHRPRIHISVLARATVITSQFEFCSSTNHRSWR